MAVFVPFIQYLGDIEDNDDNDDEGNHDDNDDDDDNEGNHDDDDGDGVDIEKHLRLSSSLSRSCLVSCFSTYFEQDDDDVIRFGDHVVARDGG